VHLKAGYTLAAHRNTRENKNSWNPWSQSGGWKVEELWKKGFVEKYRFAIRDEI